MSSTVCVIIAGALWIGGGPDEPMVKADSVYKQPGYETVVVRSAYGGGHEFDVDQHQLRMGSEEFLVDCIYLGYELTNPSYDDIDDTENTAD